MRLSRPFAALSVVASFVVMSSACGSDESSSPGQGGSGASAGSTTLRGGETGFGGAPIANGGKNSGGAATSGGRLGAGGSSGSYVTGGAGASGDASGAQQGGVPSGAMGGADAGASGSSGASSGEAGRTGAGGARTCPLAGTPTARGQLPSPPVSEASGVAASILSPNVLYTVNDSGSGTFVFAITTTGELIASIDLEGALKEDWEDVSVGPGPEVGKSYIYVADIGDNDRVRTTSIVVHRIVEPTLDVNERDQELSVAPVSLYLRYPDGAHNAETLLVDPVTSDFYVITKGDPDGSRVYSAKAPHSTSTIVELDYLLSLPFGEAPLTGSALATSGSIARDGSAILLRSYDTAFWWPRQSGQSIAEVLRGEPCALPIASDEKQGEGITFARDGGSYFTLGEGAEPTLYQITLSSR